MFLFSKSIEKVKVIHKIFSLDTKKYFTKLKSDGFKVTFFQFNNLERVSKKQKLKKEKREKNKKEQNLLLGKKDKKVKREKDKKEQRLKDKKQKKLLGTNWL